MTFGPVGLLTVPVPDPPPLLTRVKVGLPSTLLLQTVSGMVTQTLRPDPVWSVLSVTRRKPPWWAGVFTATLLLRRVLEERSGETLSLFVTL